MGPVLMLCVRMIWEDILVRSFPPIRGQNAEICFSHVAVVNISILVCDAAAKKRVICGVKGRTADVKGPSRTKPR